MNRTYRLVRNRATGRWTIALAALGLMAQPGLALADGVAGGALPTGGRVVSGQVTIDSSGAAMTVTQETARGIINWQGFDVGADASVTFKQPDAASVTLNRVIAGAGSVIAGKVSANGKVYVVNPNGVLFAKGAQVNVGGLLASTADIVDRDFLAGREVFIRDGAPGVVVNEGTITTRGGGSVVLVGGQVSNPGVIAAAGGHVALASGAKITLSAGANGRLLIEVDGDTTAGLVENGGLIAADGGQVMMTAQGVGTAISSVVANTGTIQARTIGGQAGRILLLADMDTGQARIGGVIDASAPAGGDGGFVETSAARVAVADGTQVTTRSTSGRTGTWLIDPHDVTISAGPSSGAGGLTASADDTVINVTTLTNALANTGVTISTGVGGAQAGNITVAAPISWSADTILTLDAAGDVVINAPVAATGANAGLALNYGGDYRFGTGARVTLSGANASLSLNGAAYTLIHDVGQLQAIQNDLAGRYALAGDIDASATSSWNAGAGFTPLGMWGGTAFSGALHGLGNTISDLSITGTTYVGLFGYSQNGTFRDFGLTGASTIRSWVPDLVYIGALAGIVVNAKVSNVFSTLKIYSGATETSAGGLIGEAYQSTISNAYTTGDVTSINAGEYVGGLVGGIFATTVSNSHATGVITARSSNPGHNGHATYSGGLVGYVAAGSLLSGGYATGPVTGGEFAGGLVGLNGGVIEDSYATGAVSNYGYAGGLVASNIGAIRTSYATGAVSGDLSAGGLVGDNSGSVGASFWDVTRSGLASGIGAGAASAGVSGLTAAQMTDLSTFTAAGWNIDAMGGTSATWRIYDGQTAPLLRGFLKGVTVTALGDGKTYDGLAYAGGAGFTNSTPGAALLGSLTYGGSAVGAVNTGSYAIKAGGLYSDQQGYDISYVDGALTIGKAALTVTALNDAKTYDGLAFGGGAGVGYVGLVNGETALVLGGALVYGGTAQGAVNAGSYGLTVSGLNSGNYDIRYVDGVLTIGKAALTVTALGASKVYDGVAYAGGAGVDYAGFVNGETASALGGALVHGGTAQGAISAGSYGLTVSGLSSGNYDIRYVDGALTIGKAILIVTASGVGKVYDGAVSATVSFNDNRAAGSALIVTGDAAFTDRNAGADKVIAVSGLTLSGADAGNYTLASRSITAVADIARRPVDVAATPQTLTAGHDMPALTFGLGGGGLVGGDTAADVFTGSLASTALNNFVPGTYVITRGTLAAGGNYAIADFAAAPLTILASPHTLTAGEVRRMTAAATDTPDPRSPRVGAPDLTFAAEFIRPVW
ncbi:beta strand repeat-containing protein [Caulobacter sp. AP07]|uniref:beta strand repeat-containing protein n=1 Tax=Caulobacter sp. AP07 TaxID=1144304 RepID=UPI0003146C68|nr:MBG domain-containing protein [Caulobacter sp. AP07]